MIYLCVLGQHHVHCGILVLVGEGVRGGIGLLVYITHLFRYGISYISAHMYINKGIVFEGDIDYIILERIETEQLWHIQLIPTYYINT